MTGLKIVFIMKSLNIKASSKNLRMGFHPFLALIPALLLWSTLPCSSQAIYKQLRAFGFPELSGYHPEAPLTEGTNGLLYGLTLDGGQAGLGTLFRMKKDGSEFVFLKHFTGTNGDGRNPGTAGLLVATNGFLYGTTPSGGNSNAGTIFRIDHDGSNYTVMRSLTGVLGDGKTPGTLIQASNGVLYSTTSAGGDFGLGTVYRVNIDGSGYAVIRSFVGGATDGAKPAGGLLQGTNGMLFGATSSGGTSNLGTAFSLNLDGTGYQVLKNFTGAPGDGAQPNGLLVQGADGSLYGTTFLGGSSNLGTIYSLSENGSSYQVMASFTGTNGSKPLAPLMFATNGVLYGTTSLGGTNGYGTVFQINPNGSSFQVLKNYYDYYEQDGAQPFGRLFQASNGALFGTTLLLGFGSHGAGYGRGTAFRMNLDGTEYTVIRSFSETGGDGVEPVAPLLEATNGWLYGTTPYGGSYSQGGVFKVNKDGTVYTLIHSFSGTNENPALPDGASPQGGLAQGTDGVLYGTTSADYTAQLGLAGVVFGNGTVFKINQDGSGYEVLNRFAGGNDGRQSFAGLIQASNGVLYGTTVFGGTQGNGTIFKLNPNGSGYSVLASFAGSTGSQPMAPVLQGSDGKLYGTTASGGASGNGTVFRLNLDGTGYQVLKNFSGTDGRFVASPLIQGLDNTLYGMTSFGGSSYDVGTVFKLNLDGSGFKTLKRFTGTASDGKYPKGGLVQAPNGILYGTTSGGGADNPPSGGTVFQLNPDGTAYAVIYSFQDFSNGGAPSAGLIRSGDGTLFGTTTHGGLNDHGMIFRLIPPAVMLAPVPGVSGWLINILGLPGHMYTLRKSPAISGFWQTVGSVAVGTNGAGQFQDFDHSAAAAFYRTTDP